MWYRQTAAEGAAFGVCAPLFGFLKPSPVRSIFGEGAQNAQVVAQGPVVLANVSILCLHKPCSAVPFLSIPALDQLDIDGC